MAVNHDIMAQALRLGHRRRCRNDYVTGTAWYFQGKLLVTKAPGCFLFSCHGWNTISVRQRLNALFLHCGISLTSRGKNDLRVHVPGGISMVIDPDDIMVASELGMLSVIKTGHLRDLYFPIWESKLKPL